MLRFFKYVLPLLISSSWPVQSAAPGQPADSLRPLSYQAVPAPTQAAAQTFLPDTLPVPTAAATPALPSPTAKPQPTPKPTQKPSPLSPLPPAPTAPPVILQAAASATPSPSAEPTPSPIPVSGLVEATNRQRTANGLPPLHENPKLDQAASQRVSDMFAKQYFSHATPSGGNYLDFITAAGYAWSFAAENLAEGSPRYPGDPQTVDLWMNSPGHRANLLSASATEIGTAWQAGTYQSQPTWIAVQLFGSPKNP